MLMRLVVHEGEPARREVDAGHIIEALRLRAIEIAREELHRTVKRIGADQEVEAQLAAMAEVLVTRLLHPPSVRLRQASRDGRHEERLVAAAVQMFGLAVAGARTREI